MKFTALTNIRMDGQTITYGDIVDVDPSGAWQLCENGAIYPVPSDLEEAERAGLPLKPEAASEALRVRNALNKTLQEAYRIRAEITAIKKNASPEAWRIVEAEDLQGKLAFPVTLTSEGNSASEPPVPCSESQEELGIRPETTYLNIIGGLLGLMLGKTPADKPQSVYNNQAAIIAALLGHYPKAPGIAERTLDEKFAAAKRSLKAS